MVEQLLETKKRADTMSLRTLEYAASESVVGIVRNGIMSVTSVITIALSLSVLAAFGLLAFGLNNMAQSLLEQFEIAVFLKPETSDVQTSEIFEQIKALSHVSTVRLIPKEDAWEETKRKLGKEVNLSGIKNPLPDQLCVKLKDPRFTSQVVAKIKKMPYVDDVVAARQLVERAIQVADLIKWIGIGSAGVLFLVTSFIISNTIRLTLYARRREIRIMQLVGASNWFIKLPFVLEGIILGAIGACLSFILVRSSSKYVSEVVTKNFPFLKGQYATPIEPLHFLGIMVALGCLVGAIGSLISIRRFLKA
jgi:cell division transport system permease protein